MSRDIDDSSEDVLSDWRPEEPESADELEPGEPTRVAALGTAVTEPEGVEEPQSLAVPARADEPSEEDVEDLEELEEPVPFEDAPLADDSAEPRAGAPMTIELSHEHAAGELEIPDGYAVLEGGTDGGRRGFALARFPVPTDLRRGDVRL